MRQLTAHERSLMWKALKLENGRQALLLNYPDQGRERSRDEVNRNLLCVDAKERVYWQVNAPPPSMLSGDPFVDIVADESKLTATRFSGDICDVNTSNGDAVIIGWTK